MTKNAISDEIVLSPIPLHLLQSSIEGIVTAAVKAQLEQNLSERFLSPAETCSLFQPKLSKTTLAKWTREGRLREHRFGGRVYYKYGEVISASTSLRRYTRP